MNKKGTQENIENIAAGKIIRLALLLSSAKKVGSTINSESPVLIPIKSLILSAIFFNIFSLFEPKSKYLDLLRIYENNQT